MTTTPWPGSASMRDAVRDLAPLERALDGRGPAVCPGGAPPDPSAPAPEGTAVVVGTSGSTGAPKLAVLSAAAVRASGEATAEHLGGHGQWMLALPPTHIAGLQVLARSLLAGHSPVALDDGPFSADGFADAAARLSPGVRHYTSLVPTQLVRLLASPRGTAAAAAYDAILVGGAALPGPVHERARAAGLTIVRTYGMSETSGGCVYDGRPLSCARVRLDEGRIVLGGAMVADGYLGEPGLTARQFVTEDGVRWFRTDDLGALADDGALTVLGRADDVILTGGLKVAPRVVEDAILTHVPEVRECVVVGVPDPEWGQVVGALLVGAGGAGADTGWDLDRLRESLRPHLAAHALPRVAAGADAIPLKGPGKPDRTAARHLLGP
ncbi:o-succinylbenzoate--CoA ligase [Arsenicicoccus sp. oral taxon 190]|uniref:o-succinylbenzoate--CoA ligase n=1 Tax=Arsenicicoccus sp. oral taxon 190 TaxID=1658671 RepID=UPI000679ED2F|nr:o-succinylbenzoate--CoA ligase [Arsenicicoccus sp. oral taxon 190]AKT51207.1 hypothetical protein ADJ73_07585 [Arsenicicoccus sp. oral taxon 190]